MGDGSEVSSWLAMGCDQCNTCNNCVHELTVDFNGLFPRCGRRFFPMVPRSNKRALLVGIKYKGRCRLDGSVNDVRFMKMLLCHKFRFPAGSVLVLTDDNDECDPRKRPTIANIRRGMRWLVEGCTYGDSLVFHFSGHGNKVNVEEDSDDDDDDDEECDDEDESDNEEREDCYYETICALDGDITDDEINRTIVRPLLPGVKLHAIVDSSQSDTVLDLANICDIRWSGCHEWGKDVDRRSTKGGCAIMISSGTDREDEDDYDYKYRGYGGCVMGALTAAFFAAAMAEPPPLTYGRLLATIKANLQKIKRGRCCALSAYVSEVNNYSGVLAPQLSSSYQFNIDRTNFTL